jgi:hypothetical protein
LARRPDGWHGSKALGPLERVPIKWNHLIGTRSNSFGQWGVELGKELANQLTPIIADRRLPVADFDASTAGHIAAARKLG